jgi:uncharacterized membrane protein
MKIKRFFKNQISNLLYGFVFWLPIILVLLIAVYIFANVENFGKNIINSLLPSWTIYPGTVSLICLIMFFITGLIMHKTRINKFLSKIPIIGIFFGDGQVLTFEKLSKMTPCLFLLSQTCPSYGWIITEEKVKLDGEENDALTLVNIYYPNVPTLVTGQVFPVRREEVMKLGNNSKEIIDLLLYASKSPKHIKYLPWPDEDAGLFKKRAEKFGLV